MREPVDGMVLALDLVAPTVQGAIQGCVYGLLGLGLVLLYKSNKVFNFAQGEFGTTAAFATLFAVSGTGFLPQMPLWLAVLFGLFIGVLVALVVERLVVRPLFNAPKVTLVVATAGVALLLIAVQGFMQGAEPGNFPALRAGDVVNAGGVRLTWQGVIIIFVLAVLAVAAALFFSRTRTGTAIIAVSQEPTATSLVGISVARTSMLTWGLAGFLGAVAGILLSGTLGLIAPGSLTGLALIPAFTAAVFGGMTSLPGAFLGGVVIGVIEQLASANIPTEYLPGSGRVTLFVALLLVLLVRPQGLLGKTA
ncbi:MAG TPA: branched-chain amino acid ABC transporter permease [Egibacteraceae bacterium]|nr:branched-chain amino acid ABC transporter permease [Egibacteraceae bacterium]